ncbi:hypothetical protein OK351_09230 [Glutamicibacter sp. MNS18]|uniref:hypothetical protein n=1 Tax=Glutamicibacter sp. MNS18 TaxID=2989817 RepID=UPI0022368C08|nr:hypothetical protein [Glutamicibacter sp. MNS18]MCW4465688.1 hypothetical protein [Glutamicibacter sp. MNS18]
MRFVFEVNFESAAMQLNPREELQQILRHWAKNLELYPMEPGAQEDIFDSGMEAVGEWAILDD